MRVMIAAGGTGGHIYPGIAVAREIMRRDANSRVRFVGTRRGLETKLVPQAGFELSFIESAGLKNMSLHRKIQGVALLPKSFWAAVRLIRSFRPDVVVGTGGYVTGPVLLTASMMRVPTLILESNAMPGLTNRILARFVDKAAVAFETAVGQFRGKAIVTGNPVRHEFFSIQPKPHNPSRFHVLVFGGSQGARAINEAMVAALSHLDVYRESLRITHQTGKLDFEKVAEGYAKAGWRENADIKIYIDDMVGAFAGSDLIISRAGAATIFELSAAGKAAILIPFPGQIEQRTNSEAVQATGAGHVLSQQELSGATLAQSIIQLMKTPESMERMRTASRQQARENATAVIVDLIESLSRIG